MELAPKRTSGEPMTNRTPVPSPPTPRRGLIARLRSNFLTGLVIVLPVGLTIWLIWTVVGWIDGFVLPLIPEGWTPDVLVRRLVGPWFRNLIGLEGPIDPSFTPDSLRGIGVVIFLVFTVLMGWIAKGYLGRSILRWAESMVERIPVVRSVYNGVKQIAETVFSQAETSFEKSCMIEYPRKGVWAVGFISTDARGEIAKRDPAGEPLVSVFLPTTPNPTSGFLLFLPKSEVIELDMSVEEAAKLVISAGLVYPNGKNGVERADTGL